MEALPDIEAEERLDQFHANGLHIAKVHLTPFLTKLTDKHGYSRLEMASALLIIAYNILRREKSRPIARYIYKRLTEKSQSYIDALESKQIN